LISAELNGLNRVGKRGRVVRKRRKNLAGERAFSPSITGGYNEYNCFSFPRASVTGEGI
jgi:hypothetical protein